MISKLNDLSIVITIIQILLGGVILSIFKLWLIREDELDKTIALRKERKYEEVCESLQHLVDRIVQGTSIRGSGGELPDVTLSFTKKVIQVGSDFEYFKRSKRHINNLHTFLIATSLLGVVFLIIALCISSHLYIISLASIVIVLCQIVGFFIIRAIGTEINGFDNL